MTRGRFWPLLWLLVATIIIALVVSIVGTALVTMLFEYLNKVRPHHHGISPILVMIRFGELVVPAILTTLGWIIVAAPSAAVYRDLREQPGNLGTVAP